MPSEMSGCPLEAVLDPDALERQIANGLITRRCLVGAEHVVVLNYTAKTVGHGAWTTETRRCRGLVVDEASDVLLARPFEKFFDLGQTNVPLGGAMVASEKWDGSLGILYRRPDGELAITTRGDPNSWQAEAATRLWRERYPDVVVPDGETWLFEIILPENRVVVNYGEQRDLVALAAIDMHTGRDLGLPAGFPGPVASRFDVSGGRLGEVLAELEQVGNKEGLVVFWPAEGVRAKVKLPEYHALHRLTFATSNRTIWQTLVEGRNPIDALTGVPVPDGLPAFVERHVTRLKQEHTRLVAEAHETVDALPEAVRAERRLAAAAIKQTARPNLAFLALDGRHDALSDAAWRAVRPVNVEFFAKESADG